MFVCHCEAVNDEIVQAAIASGADTVDEVTERCHAGGGCGRCRSLLQEMIDVMLAREAVGSTAA
jgi:bacterioferritin-associated ferredoxin